MGQSSSTETYIVNVGPTNTNTGTTEKKISILKDMHRNEKTNNISYETSTIVDEVNR